MRGSEFVPMMGKIPAGWASSQATATAAGFDAILGGDARQDVGKRPVFARDEASTCERRPRHRVNTALHKRGEIAVREGLRRQKTQFDLVRDERRAAMADCRSDKS